MPFFIRKSVRFGPLRLNLSKSGVGVSGGVRGLRVGAGPRGRYIHAGRGGMYYRKTISGPKGVSPRQPLPDPPPAISRAHELELEEIDSGDVLVRDPKYHAGASSVVKRSRVALGDKPPRIIKTNIPVPNLPAGKQTLYFFPDRLLVFSRGGVGAVPYRELAVDMDERRFIEDEGRVPGRGVGVVGALPIRFTPTPTRARMGANRI